MTKTPLVISSASILGLALARIARSSGAVLCHSAGASIKSSACDTGKTLPSYRPIRYDIFKKRFAAIGRGLSQTSWASRKSPSTVSAGSINDLLNLSKVTLATVRANPHVALTRPPLSAPPSRDPGPEDEGEGRRFISKGILRLSRTVFAPW